MLHCWSETAKSRPSFAELYEKLDGFLSAETALVIYFNSLVNFKIDYTSKYKIAIHSHYILSQYAYSNGLFREGVKRFFNCTLVPKVK